MARQPLPPEGRASALWLSALLFLLPFEPRMPVLRLFGVETTLLEAGLAIAGVALLWLGRERVATVLRQPPAPLVYLAAYAVVHVAASVVATDESARSLKFALRMLVMAGFAVLVAAAPPRARRSGLEALALSSAIVAALAVLEVAGVRSLDPFLASFRESPFNVGGWRRATAGSEYPNLAAAMLLYGLLAGTGIAVHGGWRHAVALPWSVLVCAGLLATYSRGAWIAAGLGLTAVALALLVRDRAAVRWPSGVLAVLLVSGAATAAAGPAFRLRLETEGIGSWYGAVYAPAQRQLRLAPGETQRELIRVTNTGQRTWTVGDGFHLSYHWYDRERRSLGDGGRTQLPHDLTPGESAQLTALVRAPVTEGAYLLAWDMVHEHTTWFSGQGVRPAVVTVVVSRDARGSTDALAQDLPAADEWRPGRGELWRLAIGMWRERPLLGFGSDSFRRLYGPRSGHFTWDARVFANNTLLEAAATTGSIGLLALVATLVAAGGTAWRALGPDADVTAPAFFGLLVGITAHGLVDYVLAFTGHYVMFGFVIGGIAALARRGSPS